MPHDGSLELTVDKVRWVLRPEAEDVAAALKDGIDGLMDSGEVIKAKKHRRIVKAALPDNGREVIIKEFRNRGTAERLKRTLLPTTATREWHLANAMLEENVPAPKPLAVGHRSRGALNDDCWLIMEALPNPRPLREVLEAAPPPAVRRDLIERAAKLVRLMHDAEFMHYDLHAENLLLYGADDAPAMVVIDMQAVRRRKMDFYRRCEDLARLWKSVPDSGIRNMDLLRFLGTYLAAAEFDPKREPARPLSDWIHNIRDDVQILLRDYWRGRTNRCMVESSLFTSDKQDARTVYRRRELSLDDLDTVLRAHEAAIAEQGDNVLKDTRHSRVTLVTDPRDASARVCVKEFRPRGRKHRMKALYRKPPVLREWIAARGLEVRKVRTPMAFACVLGEEAGASNFLVTRELVGGEPANLYFANASADWPHTTRRAFLNEFADMLVMLHHRDVVHGDMKGTNVLVTETTDGGHEFTLIDLGGTRFRKPYISDIVRMLAQINASCHRVVSPTDRVRVLKRYVTGIGQDRHIRDILRAVLRMSSKRTQVWERL